jgi:predicted GTPase
MPSNSGPSHRRQRVLILGAAGRDFHNFNVAYRRNPRVQVVGFTANQIPGIEGRLYPPGLAGPYYLDGLPIWDEADLEEIIRRERVDACLLSYSDLPYRTVGNLASRVTAAGAHFGILAAQTTMLRSHKPVVSVCAVRTGCGKSQTSRRVVEILREAGKRVVSIRHPMPYGDLTKQICQRFATLEDLALHECTIEEMEEYEPHIRMGSVIYAGVDYAEILRQAEAEADVIIWDGGNNDTSFYAPDCHIVVADPFRVGHETGYYPGETNLRLADVVVINKVNTAAKADVDQLVANCRAVNPDAAILLGMSNLKSDNDELIRGKRVLVVEDGPTVTHGEMATGAGCELAKSLGAELVDARPFAVGELAATYQHYPNIGTLLPAMGYGEQQIRDLEATINACACDAVVVGTPFDLLRLVKLNKPAVRVAYDLDTVTKGNLAAILKDKGII